MAEHSVTITERLKVREATPEDVLSLWGTMVWGTDGWYGESWDTTIDFEQWLSNSISLALALGKQVEKGFAEGITLSDAIGKILNLAPFANGISIAQTWSTARTQGDWTHQEPDVESWTAQSADSETWTEQSDASTTWS